jgi:hypothetical protein
MDKKLAEEKVREMFDSLTPEQLAELQNSFAETMDKLKVESVQKLQSLKSELEAVENKKKSLGSEYGNWDEKQKLIKSIETLSSSVLNQENVVKVLENNGLIANITDEHGFEYNEVPDFRKVDTSEFNFDEKTVLTDPIPKYVPFINEEKFRGHGYVFDAIRVTEDSYMVCLGTYSTKEKDKNNFFIATLDQLVLIIDYYYVKAKAKNIEEAKRANERSRENYFNLSEEKRRYYMFQRNIYSDLSVAQKKKVSREEFEAMDLEDREKYYLPIKNHGVKRIVSKLGENQMWISFHNMYEDLIDKTKTLLDKNGNPDPKGRYANSVVMKYWRDFAEMINYKLKDIKIQREDYSDTYKQAIETSFGESNVDTILKEKYGILVKRQNGDKIKPIEIELIKNSWIEIQKVYGNLKAEAVKHNLKISHSGEKLMFAMKALGVYISQMGTIGVSNKLGEVDFKSTFSHEVAHFIDNFIGELNGKRWATDNYESLAGKIAFTFRNSMNKNKKDQTDYINATKECFARAFQQYFGMKTEGEGAVTLNVDLKEFPEGLPFIKHPSFVNQITFKSEIEPMIEQFLKENLDVFETTVDIDGTNDLAPITEEEEPKLSFINTEYGITYTVEQDEKGIWTVFSESKNWERRNEYPSGFASKEDAISIAKLEAGVEKEVDPEGAFMREQESKFVEEPEEKIFSGKMENGQPFLFFVGKEPENGYKSENAKELYNEKGFWIDSQLGFNNLITGYFKDFDTMLKNTNPKYHSQLGVESKQEEQEESIQDLIDGLQILVDISEGEEKQELEDTIEGLKLLL